MASAVFKKFFASPPVLFFFFAVRSKFSPYLEAISSTSPTSVSHLVENVARR